MSVHGLRSWATWKPVGEALAGGSSDGPFWTLPDGEEQGARPPEAQCPLVDRPAGILEQTRFTFRISRPAQGHSPGGHELHWLREALSTPQSRWTLAGDRLAETP